MTTTTPEAPHAPVSEDVLRENNPDTTQLILHVLDAAAHAHHLHEVELGGPHADWSPWYAQHMARTLTEAGYRITKTPGE